VEALFPLVPVGTKVWIVNEPVKVAFVEGELLLEVHPPVDAEGQSYEPNLDQFSALLDQALGPTTTAVNWDLARETMQTANGFPTVVGLEADLDPAAPATTPEGVPVEAQPAVAASGAAPAAPAQTSEPPPATVTLPAPPPPTEPPAAISLPKPDAPAGSPNPSSSSARTFPAEEPASATAAPPNGTR
jgi:hypothetical protein